MANRSAAMPRYAVVAHFDTRHQLAYHVRRLLEELLTVCSKVVLVSSSGIDIASSRWASRLHNLKIVTRENAGYDFMSYKEGLRHLGDVEGVEVVVCNDSFVGPVVPFSSMLDQMASEGCDFWSLTESFAPEWHLQSYFFVFRPSATRDPAFAAFWNDMVPLSDRRQVIWQYELGLSRRLQAAGLTGAAYFKPRPEDIWEASARREWWSTPVGTDGAIPVWQDVTRRLYENEEERLRFNATVALADRILDGRLPVLKLEVPRLDPMALGSRWLLEECNRIYPRWFQRVEQYLQETDGATYAGRHGAVPRSPDTHPIAHRVAYHRSFSKEPK